MASFALHRLSGFAAALREAGLAVSAEEVISGVEALNALDLAESDSLYWGLRMAMVRSSDDLLTFERVFRQYWHGADLASHVEDRDDRPGTPPTPQRRLGGRGDRERASQDDKGALRPVPTKDPLPADEKERERAAYSTYEVLRTKDFADYDDRDYARLETLLREARSEGPWRISRRKRIHKTGLLDIRNTLRASFRTAGHPIRRHYRRPKPKHRQLTFVCDVSGSMEPYSMAMLQLAHLIAERRPSVDAFTFATRLTRVRDELRARESAMALAAATSKVADWSGGTRMGPCLQELNRSYRSAIRGAVVVIASDGWDLGDPKQLASQVHLLHRFAHTLIWVNPHLQDPEFEPLTRGMSAALPAVDHFISCHNFESFGTLHTLLEESGIRQPTTV